MLSPDLVAAMAALTSKGWKEGKGGERTERERKDSPKSR